MVAMRAALAIGLLIISILEVAEQGVKYLPMASPNYFHFNMESGHTMCDAFAAWIKINKE